MGVGGLGHILQYSEAIPGSLLRNDLGIAQGTSCGFRDSNQGYI